MTEGTISKRLKAIAEYVPPGLTVADIGTDHAYLPTYLVQTGISTKVIAGEYNEGPFGTALQRVQSEGLTLQIDVRKGNGLAVLRPEEAEVITISGMGGGLIADILNEGRDKLSSVKRLILQPNVGERALRVWLLNEHWTLIDETILEEDGKIYEILVAERVPTQAHSDPYRDQPLNHEWLLRVGPILARKKSPLLLQKWNHELQKADKIMEQLLASDTEAAKARRSEWQLYINELEEVISCLQTEATSSKP